jgi:hypothetical protein
MNFKTYPSLQEGTIGFSTGSTKFKTLALVRTILQVLNYYTVYNAFFVQSEK